MPIPQSEIQRLVARMGLGGGAPTGARAPSTPMQVQGLDVETLIQQLLARSGNSTEPAMAQAANPMQAFQSPNIGALNSPAEAAPPAQLPTGTGASPMMPQGAPAMPMTPAPPMAAEPPMPGQAPGQALGQDSGGAAQFMQGLVGGGQESSGENDWANALMRGGLATMAASGRPGAGLFDSLGIGGLTGMNAYQDQQNAAAASAKEEQRLAAETAKMRLDYMLEQAKTQARAAESQRDYDQRQSIADRTADINSTKADNLAEYQGRQADTAEAKLVPEDMRSARILSEQTGMSIEESYAAVTASKSDSSSELKIKTRLYEAYATNPSYADKTPAELEQLVDEAWRAISGGGTGAPAGAPGAGSAGMPTGDFLGTGIEF